MTSITKWGLQVSLHCGYYQWTAAAWWVYIRLETIWCAAALFILFSISCFSPSQTWWERQCLLVCECVCVCVSLRFLRWRILSLLTRSASDVAHHMLTCVLCLMRCEIGGNISKLQIERRQADNIRILNSQVGMTWKSYVRDWNLHLLKWMRCC